ncbi:hypothetical protein NN561_000580 [Cricetulus griseus]
MTDEGLQTYKVPEPLLKDSHPEPTQRRDSASLLPFTSSEAALAKARCAADVPRLPKGLPAAVQHGVTCMTQPPWSADSEIQGQMPTTLACHSPVTDKESHRRESVKSRPLVAID